MDFNNQPVDVDGGRPSQSASFYARSDVRRHLPTGGVVHDPTTMLTAANNLLRTLEPSYDPAVSPTAAAGHARRYEGGSSPGGQTPATPADSYQPALVDSNYQELAGGMYYSLPTMSEPDNDLAMLNRTAHSRFSASANRGGERQGKHHHLQQQQGPIRPPDWRTPSSMTATATPSAVDIVTALGPDGDVVVDNRYVVHVNEDDEDDLSERRQHQLLSSMPFQRNGGSGRGTGTAVTSSSAPVSMHLLEGGGGGMGVGVGVSSMELPLAVKQLDSAAVNYDQDEQEGAYMSCGEVARAEDVIPKWDDDISLPGDGDHERGEGVDHRGRGGHADGVGDASQDDLSDYDGFEMRSGLSRRFGEGRDAMLVKIVSLLCIGGVLQGILVNGLINVVISSLERRFGIKSTESGLIASSYDIASFICLLPVSYLGGRGSGTKPGWIGGGIAVMGLGSLLFSLPHFLTGVYTTTPLRMERESGDGDLYSSISLCNQSTMCSEEDAGGDNSYKYVFMLAQLLHGAGAAPLYTLGVTYIDENAGSESSAFYLGVFYTMAIIGPAIGFSLGGQLLNIHTDFFSDSSDSRTRDSSTWVGAWWLGFLICGVSALVLSIAILFLPESLPGTIEPPSDQVCRSRLASRHSSFRSSVRSRSGPLKSELLDLTAGTGPLPMGKELISALVVLLSNPTFLCICLAGACEGFLMQGLATFLPKLLQNQYSLTESQAAINVGAVSVVAGGGGTLLGGLIVRRLGLKVAGLLKLTSATQFVAILFAIGLMSGCADEIQLTGPSIGRDQACSAPCHCSKYDYSPVCAGNEQFFNPCWAGCTARHQVSGEFLNCSCVSSVPRVSKSLHMAAATMELESGHAPPHQVVMPGLCPSACSLLPLFLSSFFFTMLITFLANMPSLTATLRCVDPTVRSLALGIQWLLIRLLGTIPGPVAMGRLFDNNCSYWKLGCGDVIENCLIYNNASLSKYIMVLTAICKGFSIVFFLAGVRMYKLPVENKEAEKKDDMKTTFDKEDDVDGEKDGMPHKDAIVLSGSEPNQLHKEPSIEGVIEEDSKRAASDIQDNQRTLDSASEGSDPMSAHDIRPVN